MDPTLRTRAVLAASFMSSLMFGLTIMERGAIMDLGVSGFAAIALLAGGLFLERALAAEWRKTLTRSDAALAGVLIGLPLSFFMLQHKVALESGNLSVTQGSERVVGTVGLILIVSAVYGAWRRRRDQRM